MALQCDLATTQSQCSWLSLTVSTPLHVFCRFLDAFACQSSKAFSLRFCHVTEAPGALTSVIWDDISVACTSVAWPSSQVSSPQPESFRLVQFPVLVACPCGCIHLVLFSFQVKHVKKSCPQLWLSILFWHCIRFFLVIYLLSSLHLRHIWTQYDDNADWLY